MRISSFAAIAFAGVALIAATPRNAIATDFTYTGDSCGILGCGFNAPANWSPSGGPPGADDMATIAIADVIVLTENTEAINTLNIRNGASVSTGFNQLNVTGGANGFTEVIGGSRLGVQSGAFFDFVTDTLSLRQSGELDMMGGGAIAQLVMRVSTSSLISGYGVVALTTGSGIGLDLAGTVRPDGGSLTLRGLNTLLDLDGNIGGNDVDSLLDVTADGDLLVDGTLNDPFSGRLHIGNDNRVEFMDPLLFDGALNFVSHTNNRLVAPSVTFQSGAQVTVDTAEGRLQASTTFLSGSQVNLVGLDDQLMFYDDSTIHSGASFSGSGVLANVAGGTMTLRDGADVGVLVGNGGAGALRIGSSPGAATVAAFVQTAPASLEIELGGLAPSTGFDQLIITGGAFLGGSLDVSLFGGFTLSDGDSFEILDIGTFRLGQFAGLPEGALVGNFGDDLFITYAGGDGNDVVLYTTTFTVFSADFDNDNDVDGRDFLLIQRSDPSLIPQWETEFGTGVGPLASSQAVPEPTSGVLCLTLLGYYLALLWRGKHFNDYLFVATACTEYHNWSFATEKQRGSKCLV